MTEQNQTPGITADDSQGHVIRGDEDTEGHFIRGDEDDDDDTEGHGVRKP